MSDAGVIWLAVDPSLTDSGVAVRFEHPQPEGRISAEEWSETLPIEEAGAWLNAIQKGMEDYQVYLLVEEPAAGKGRRGNFTFSMDSVKSAARCWEDAVRRRWPRKNSMRRCKPAEWRAVVFGKHLRTFGDPKDASMKLTGFENHNQADAACLMKYLTYLMKTKTWEKVPAPARKTGGRRRAPPRPST